MSCSERFDKVNIKIVYNFNEGVLTRLLYYSKPSYPDEALYRTGVKATLYMFERENPGAKILRNNLKRSISGILESKSAYEAVLVNKEGMITEGSRIEPVFY